MSFKKPFQAVPVRPGPRYRPRREEPKQHDVLRILIGAAFVGGAIGIGSVVVSDGNLSSVRTAAAKAELIRTNSPPPGAFYPGCNAARAAGVAPLYRGEPGYRPEMDGDSDGIACEPYR